MYAPHYPAPPRALTTQQLQRRAGKFRKMKSLTGVARLLGTTELYLQVMVAAGTYQKFSIAKPGGGRRKIENPNDELKKLQKRIAFYLQAIYTQRKPACSYGFVLTTTDDADRRNIYTNALQHVGARHLLNVDLKDFFHSITFDQVRRFFRRAPFLFSPAAARCLAGLCTYRGRLPMGAPTSPVLSNLLFIPTDEALSKLAATYGWTYTRYVDDMTFSGKRKFKRHQLAALRETLQGAGFQVNEKKWKKQQRKKGKYPEVTGLILKGKKPDLKREYLHQLNQDIEVYRYLTSPAMAARKLVKAEAITRLRRSIVGQINFVGFIKGDHHKLYHHLRSRMHLSNRLRPKASKPVTRFGENSL